VGFTDNQLAIVIKNLDPLGKGGLLLEGFVKFVSQLNLEGLEGVKLYIPITMQSKADA